MIRYMCALIFCFLLVPFSEAEVIEPKTKETFPDTLTHEDHHLQCTGATYRSKFGIKIYAIAHYGDPAAAPEGDETAKLDTWTKAKAWKAISLSFVFSVDESNMRNAAEGALDEAKYDKPEREAFLDAFSREYPSGTKVQLIASEDGVLRIIMDGKTMGEYKDQELIDALWMSWLGPDTVVTDRELLVKREIK